MILDTFGQKPGIFNRASFDKQALFFQNVNYRSRRMSLLFPLGLESVKTSLRLFQELPAKGMFRIKFQDLLKFLEGFFKIRAAQVVKVRPLVVDIFLRDEGVAGVLY